MRGSCAPPAPGALWSLYGVKKEIPQAINGWVTTGPAAQAPLLYCSKNFNLGSQLSNCFSFACNNERYINGVPVASCYCPLGESPEGAAVRAAHRVCDPGRSGRLLVLRRIAGRRPGLATVTGAGRIRSVRVSDPGCIPGNSEPTALLVRG